MRCKLIIAVILFLSIKTSGQEQAQSSFNQGVKELQNKNFVQAEEEFASAIKFGKTERGLKMSYIYKGFAHNGQGEYNDAILCFNEAIEIDPQDAASYIDRGLAYTYIVDYENAILDFKKVLNLDSPKEQTIAAFYYLGKVMMFTFKYESAINYFDQLIELKPLDAEAYFLRGTAKSNLMIIDESIADYDKAIELEPNYMEALANRGVQKINKIPVKQKLGKKIDCLEDPCRDLLKAKKLGDSSIDDMIFIYCSNCKN